MHVLGGRKTEAVVVGVAAAAAAAAAHVVIGHTARWRGLSS